MPVTPVQLENLGVPGYLDSFRVLLLTYQGMKPLTPEVHSPWSTGSNAVAPWWWSLDDHTYSSVDQPLWLRFPNTTSPRELVVRFK